MKKAAKATFHFGRVSPLKSELYGRVTNLRLVRDIRTDWVSSLSTGGDKRDRTAGLLNAIQALSQLSYTPVFEVKSNSA